MTTPVLLPRYFAHFLPKFDNLSEERLVGPLVDADPSAFLVVSKKHSGSLVMAPPFFSKNGCGNVYSRMGAVVLREHFRAVWGAVDADDVASAAERGEAQFQAWWADSEARGLCYSFEIVVPRLLGDHGATPAGAFAILTAVASTREERLLSPLEMIRLATKWRLPLDEAWYVPAGEAAAVEHRLRDARWVLRDEGVAEIMRSARGALSQGFLPHGVVQGPVLEGFVLMALSVQAPTAPATAAAAAAAASGASPRARGEQSLDYLRQLLDEYERAVGGTRARACAAALALGARCLAAEPALVRLLNEPIAGCSEPTRVSRGGDSGEAALWRRLNPARAPGSLGATPLCRLLGTLESVYAQRITTKEYRYKGITLVQIQVHADEVFFAFAATHARATCADLFRGLVLALGESEGADSASGPSDAGVCGVGDGGGDEGLGPGSAAGIETVAPQSILAIAKLKCLPYLLRTFGVRNLLGCLLEQGTAAYLQRVDRFAETWGVPKPLRPPLRAQLARWANYVARLPAAERARLLPASYLTTLEPFLKHDGGAAAALDGGEAAGGVSAGSALAARFVVVVNLTGGALAAAWEDAFATAGLSRADAAAIKRPQAGLVVEVCTPPPSRLTGSDGGVRVVVLCLPPPADSTDARLRSMWRALADGGSARYGGALVVVEPPVEPTAVAELAASIDALEAALDAGADGGRTAEGAEAEAVVVHVLAVACLPPGGGKSTLFEQLRALGCEVVSSDECRRVEAERAQRGAGHGGSEAAAGDRAAGGRGGGNGAAGDFTQQLGRAVRRAAGKGAADGAAARVVCADKNFPKIEGLVKLTRGLLAAPSAEPRGRGGGGARARPPCVRVHLVVPSALDAAELDACWARVCARPADHVGLALAADRLDEAAKRALFRATFAQPSADARARVAALGRAVESGAFFDAAAEGMRALAAELLARATDDGAGVEAGALLLALERALAGRGGGDPDGAAADASPSLMAAGGPKGRKSSWACAKLDDAPLLHLTLVPPAAPAEAEAARLAALDALGARADGRALRVRCDWLHIARPRAGDASAGCIAFWEVGHVDGLEPELHYAPQARLYHVTDVASLGPKLKPKQAGQVLAELVERRQRRVQGDAGDEAPALTVLDEWEVEHVRAQPPLVLHATVRLCA